MRNLAKRSDLERTAIDRRIGHLNQALPGALSEVPDSLIEAMPVNENDRHVLALAVHIGAPTIVTDNLRDFPADLLDPFGIEAISPDEFTLAQVDLHPQAVLDSIDAMAARRRRSPKTRAEIIARLHAQLPAAMTALLDRYQ